MSDDCFESCWAVIRIGNGAVEQLWYAPGREEAVWYASHEPGSVAAFRPIRPNPRWRDDF